MQELSSRMVLGLFESKPRRDIPNRGKSIMEPLEKLCEVCIAVLVKFLKEI